MERRDFLSLAVKAAIAGGTLGSAQIALLRRAGAAPAALGLSDPALQPKFMNLAPNAPAPSFKFAPDSQGQFSVAARESKHLTGLVDPKSGRLLRTPIWGYGDERGPTWPGRTFEVKSLSAGGTPETMVRWASFSATIWWSTA
jgi:spore coat protein A